LYVVGAGRTAAPDQIAKLDRIRREWETFFSTATESRMRVRTQ
jgi:hypothetical protein